MAHNVKAITAGMPINTRSKIVPFTAITYAILYYDIRIRTEGLDLEASVERLIAGDAAPA